MYPVVVACEFLGLALAAASLPPLREVASLAPTPLLRRAWSALALLVFACLAFRVGAMALDAGGSAPGDPFDAGVFVLGPTFVLVVAHLFRRTALDVARLAAAEHASLVDPLTELANRRHFDRRLAEDLRGDRSAGTSLHLVLFDVDRFKRFNDQHGHHFGDLVLRQVGRTMEDCIPRRSLACRIGGDEFALIASDVAMDGGQLP